MALKLVINISKKVPMPGVDYASTSASCSIEGEVAAGQDPAAEAARLYHQAEAAVDTQLARVQPGSPGSSGSGVPAGRTGTPGSTAAPAAASPPGASGAGRPYQRTTRKPAPITPSQFRLLSRLVQSTGTDAQAICQHHGVAGLDHLTCAQASALIDDLKAKADR